jgi:hypothetical protein
MSKVVVVSYFQALLQDFLEGLRKIKGNLRILGLQTVSNEANIWRRRGEGYMKN